MNYMTSLVLELELFSWMMWAAVGMKQTFYNVLIGGLVSLTLRIIFRMQE